MTTHVLFCISVDLINHLLQRSIERPSFTTSLIQCEKPLHDNYQPLSVQRLGGGHTSLSPVFLTTWLSRALTYLFDATPPETTCKRYQKDLISWTPNRQENKKRQKTRDTQWNELTIRTKWRNCIYITKYLMEGSIFNAHSIARSHLSSRCSTATRCSKFSSISGRETK